MNLKQMKESLGNVTGNVAIVGVSSHFHITGIGKTTKDFIDCDGAIKKTEVCTLQTYTNLDFSHRISTTELLEILNLAINRLNIDETLQIEIEVQEDTICLYGIEGSVKTFEELLFTTKPKKTTCLTSDKCCGSGECCK